VVCFSKDVKVPFKVRSSVGTSSSNKHHPPAHHVNVRSEFLTKVKDLAEARCQRLEQGQNKKPHKAQAKTSYKGVLDSEELHTLSSKHLVIKENNLNSPHGRFYRQEVFM
jgi:hypothetical protein